MSLVSRQIRAVITLTKDANNSVVDFGTTPGSPADTVTLDGLQISAQISKHGSPTLDQAEVRIWGMTLSDMNKISRLGKPLNWTRFNTITLSAGDAESGMSQVFSGNINTSYADFDNAPDACMNITAQTGLIDLTKAVTPSSFPGNVSIDTIMQTIAAKMRKSFLNDGVNAQFQNVYFTGSALDQMRKAAIMANCWAIPNGGTPSQGDVLEIWPKGTARGAMGPLISPTTGLVGYPKFTDFGVSLRVLYQPGLDFGQAFTLQSSLQPANGTWFVYSLDLDLSCNDPSGSGPWFMNIGAQKTLTPGAKSDENTSNPGPTG